MPNPQVYLYTDGACSGNPGSGGWACILVCNGKEKEISGHENFTTNNRMEMMAVINGLKALTKPCDVFLFTDSRYVLDGAQKWLFSWIKNGWKTSNKKDVKNRELWLELVDLLKKHNVQWEWVKGHNGHMYNERADKLACMQRDQLSE